MAWTRERLDSVVRTRLEGIRLVVVANREPFIHRYDGEEIRCMRPASGLTTALDPVMRATGGVWVAHGSGDADPDVSDERGRVMVPPEDPQYLLRRVWLSKQEEQGYYYGLSNDTLWPLCHQAYCRPSFAPGDWEQYRAVNRKFADAVLDEVGDEPALIFVQDYHYTLLPRMLKDARPDLIVAHFWHIPWPNREVFRICPWGDQILDGLLGNDLLSFHVQYHCNNFLDTVDRSIEAKVDMERFAVTRHGHTTLVRPHPISVDPGLADELLGDDWPREAKKLRKRLRLGERPLLVGVDRVDYIKGIPERFRAVDRLLEREPGLRGRFHFVQVGTPSRSHLPQYRHLNDELEELAEEINWRHGDERWRPIVWINEHWGPKMVYLLYRMAAGCVVTSLHDGMNLVAKEFVSARADEQGVLVLSRFTGAARELADAVLINPYDIEETAAGLKAALTMPAAEQSRRMRRMRQQVNDHNIYRWAGTLLSEASRLVGARSPLPWGYDELGNGEAALNPLSGLERGLGVTSGP
jgi:trehalose 6-phosphate synthase